MMTKDEQNEKLLLNDILEWNSNMLIAAVNLKHLLNQIDYNAEVLPTGNSERLTRVLVSLKGEALDQYEASVVREMIDVSL